MTETVLDVRDLRVSVQDGEILRGVNLTLRGGEVHAVMGPNGSGKSTLAYTLAGHPRYRVESGAVTLDGRDLLAMGPDERARAGLFLAFQYPQEVPGVTVAQFLRAAVNAHRKARGEDEIDVFEFYELLTDRMKLLGMDEAFAQRQLNAGFSGGEKKRNEILQLAMLSPRVAVLDEADSGLDIDSVRIVAEGVNALRERGLGVLVITHYQRILRYLQPDFVHVMMDGRIVRSDGRELAEELEAKGYDWLRADG